MKDLQKLKKDLDAIAGSLVLGGPTLCAQKVVADLQQVGPQWTGRFSNSWQIRGPQGQTARGDGQPGKPRPIVFQSAPFTGLQAFRIAYRTFTTKDKVVFTISNFSPYSDQARDLTPFRPEESPDTRPIKPTRRGIRPVGGRRGELSGGSGPNKATAILDWYSHYLGGGQINKTIQVTMDGLNIGFR